MKTEQEAEDPRMLMNCIFLSANQSTRARFIRDFTKIAEAEGSLKKGFQKRCVPVFFFMMVPFSLDSSACTLCLFLRLFMILALIGVSWLHQNYFGVNFSRFSQLVLVFK